MAGRLIGREQLFPGDSELSSLMRGLDWSKTDLGDPEHWPEHWRTAVRLCLTSRIPVVMYWGPNFTVLYNDPYISFLGETKHPRYLGRPGQECWSEIWDTIGPMLKGVYATAKATWSEDVLMFFARRLPREEVYVRFTFGPLLAAVGRTVDGIFCPCTETTEQVVGSRRLETLRKLGPSQPRPALWRLHVGRQPPFSPRIVTIFRLPLFILPMTVATEQHSASYPGCPKRRIHFRRACRSQIIVCRRGRSPPCWRHAAHTKSPSSAP